MGSERTVSPAYAVRDGYYVGKDADGKIQTFRDYEMPYAMRPYYTYKTPEEFYRYLQDADGKAYEALPQELKQELATHVAVSTEQADVAIKAAIQQEANTLCDAIDKTQGTEAYYTPSPKTWKAFKQDEMESIHEALDSLGALVGQSAKDAKENLMERLDEVLDLTAGAIHSMKHAEGFLHHEQKRILGESVQMQEDLRQLKVSSKSMKQMLGKEDMQGYQQGKALEEDTNLLIQRFGSLYELSQASDAAKKRYPSHLAECLDLAKDAIHELRQDVESYLVTASLSDQYSQLETLGRKLQKAVRSGTSYLKGVERDAMLGRDDYRTPLPFQSAQQGKEKALETQAVRKWKETATDFIEKLVKSGKSKEEIQKLVKKLMKDMDKDLKVALERPDLKKMIQKESQKARVR